MFRMLRMAAWQFSPGMSAAPSMVVSLGDGHITDACSPARWIPAPYGGRVDYRADFLTVESPGGFRKTLNAFVAPVARHADAVAEDPQVISVADAVFRAFGDHGGTGGMTRAELASACSGVASDAVFSARFDLFVRMG